MDVKRCDRCLEDIKGRRLVVKLALDHRFKPSENCFEKEYELCGVCSDPITLYVLGASLLAPYNSKFDPHF